ncbi:hypothetical protein [Undibacterium sp.]|uniref:hypothetical protein n=1 Tax=Undibacterium sp. TaxID=1914977 RepID=UPI003750A41D
MTNNIVGLIFIFFALYAMVERLMFGKARFRLVATLIAICLGIFALSKTTAKNDLYATISGLFFCAALFELAVTKITEIAATLKEKN